MAESNSQNFEQYVSDQQSTVEPTEIPSSSMVSLRSPVAQTQHPVSTAVNPTQQATETLPDLLSTTTSPVVPALDVSSTAVNLPSPVNTSLPETSTSPPVTPVLPVTSTSPPVTPTLPVTSTSSVRPSLPATSTAVVIPDLPVTRPLPEALPATSMPPVSQTLPVNSTSSIISPSSDTGSSPVTHERTLTTTSDDESPTCGRCRSVGRSLCRTSPDRYCCIIPAKIWLKIRLGSIVLLLVGLFLVIIFPLPGMILFQIAVALLTVSAVFVFIDIGRGAIANCWCDSYERRRTQPDRVRTIEVTSNDRFVDYDNPAFVEGDRPPDYATAMATSPAPLDQRRQRPPDITINIDPSDHGRSGDAFDPTISPSSPFSLSEPYTPLSLPPSYDDVIKEDNDRQRARQQDEGDNEGPGPSSS